MSMNRKCCAAAFVAAALISSPVAAQDPPLTLTSATPYLWDVSGDIGWFTSKRANIPQTRDDRYDVPAASAAVGRYWTQHIRSEFRIATTGEGRTYQQDPVPPFVPGQPFPQPHFREHFDRTTTAGAGVYHQWFDNQWFHPFAGGGVDLARDSRRTVVYPQNQTARRVSYAARPFVATGFKWYVHEREFIRSDVKFSIGARRNVQTSWSAGIGVDL